MKIKYLASILIGTGNNISVRNQYLEFHFSYPKIQYITIDGRENFNTFIYDIRIESPSMEVSKYLNLMRSHPRMALTEEVSYFEEFTNGTFCDPIVAPRSSIVEYKCSKSGHLFEVEFYKD